MILETRKINSVTASTFFLSVCLEVMGPDAMILIFSFKPALSLSSFTLIKRLFSSSSLPTFRVVSSAYLRLLKASDLYASTPFVMPRELLTRRITVKCGSEG